MSTADAPGGASPGGASTAGEEEMEDDAEMEDDSTSNVPMLAAGGTFIAGTADGTSRNTEPSTSIVQMTILTCRSKPSARSAWRTRTNVSIAQ